VFDVEMGFAPNTSPLILLIEMISVYSGKLWNKKKMHCMWKNLDMFEVCFAEIRLCGLVLAFI
jgi:hypothetical protein